MAVKQTTLSEDFTTTRDAYEENGELTDKTTVCPYCTFKRDQSTLVMEHIGRKHDGMLPALE